MKLRLNQLQTHLENEAFSPLYIVSGDETLLVQEASDSIRQAARRAGFTEREVYHVGKDFTWADVLASLSSMSLFADRKLVELRFTAGKFDDKAKKAITHYLELAPPDTLVLVMTPKLEGSIGKSQWFQKTEQTSVFLAIWPIEPHQLGAWLKQRCIRVGFQPTQGALTLLAERVEGNLLAAAQEIEKLRLLMAPGSLDEEAIRRAVAEQSRYDIFGMVEEAVKGQFEHALKMLHYLRQSGSEPALLLWAFSKELRILASLANSTARGMPLTKAFSEQRIWESQQAMYQRALKSRSESDFRAALIEANRIDQAYKGMLSYDPWIGFQNILLLLSDKPAASLLRAAALIER